MPALIGARITRLEDEPLLRGKGRYVDDVVVPGMLHAGFVRSPHAHAAIRGISKTAALALPGVHAVLTLDDLAPVLAKRRMMRHSNSGTPLDKMWSFSLADGEVSYVGEAVAIVIADNRYIAEDAAALVDVDYDVLPAAADVRKAALADAPTVRRELGSNIIARYKVNYGDADAAFAKAAHVFHEDLWQHRGAAHSIEGRGILAEYRSADDGITAWASTQKAHDMRQSLTALLDMDESRLRVAAPDVGGGFGPKLCVYSEDVAVVAAAKLLKRSIKWIEDRREHFTNAAQERDQYWSIDIAVDGDGKLLGIRGQLLHDLGAYALQDVNLPYNSASMISGPYMLSVAGDGGDGRRHQQDAGLLGARRRLSAGVVRDGAADGPRARELKLDRAEVRRRNLIPGEKMPYQKPLKTRGGTFVQYDSGDYPASQAQVLAAVGWDDFPQRQAAARAQGRYIGIGLAHGLKGTGRGPFESGLVRVAPTGKVSVLTGAAAIGQGLRTVLAQICASELGLRAQDINVVVERHHRRVARTRRLRQPSDRDRGLVGAAGGARGRGQGEEAREPCARSRRARSRTRRRRGARGRRAAACRSSSANCRASCAARPAMRSRPAWNPGSKSNQNYRTDDLAYANACQVAEVEVDIDTGEVRILRYFALQDFRPADQSDAGRGPDPRRARARDRQRAVRMDGLRRLRASR